MAQVFQELCREFEVVPQKVVPPPITLEDVIRFSKQIAEAAGVTPEKVVENAELIAMELNARGITIHMIGLPTLEQREMIRDAVLAVTASPHSSPEFEISILGIPLWQWLVGVGAAVAIGIVAALITK